MGIGSYISLHNVYERKFDRYEGIYTPALTNDPSSAYIRKPKGKYLCGYQKGTWNTFYIMYEKMLNYAQEHNLKLTGYAYEIGLNEFVITDENKNITKIAIQVQDEYLF